jgi:hypothetical protein
MDPFVDTTLYYDNDNDNDKPIKPQEGSKLREAVTVKVDSKAF